MEKLFQFENVTLGYGSKIILKDLSFTVHKGQYIGLVGANGAGKSTLLKAVIGALSPLKGRISFFNAQGKIIERADKLGYMPQHQSLNVSFPLSVFDTVLMGRGHKMKWLISQDNKDSVMSALEKVRLSGCASRHISELSGGQLQRVLMARAIVSNPELLILDEPTNGMDPAASQDTLNTVKELHKSGMTVILVTHMLETAARHTETIGLFCTENGVSSLSWGKTAEMLTDESLSRIYGRTVNLNLYKLSDSAVKGDSL